MKYRLGIDLGTSSLGLAAYELDQHDNIKNLAYIDEVIFREPINPKDFTTLNSTRRSKRLARRQHARYVKRIKKVIHVLKLLGISKQDMQKLEKRDVFELRVRSLYEKITIPEFAKVILHIAKHQNEDFLYLCCNIFPLLQGSANQNWHYCTRQVHCRQ